MRILCVCGEGNNRSATLAQLLRYRDGGQDCLAVGLRTASPETLDMLFRWAEVILLTARDQSVPEEHRPKVRLVDMGPDTYPRPFNKDLLSKCGGLLASGPPWGIPHRGGA
jgi:hypothetical protein